MAAPPLDPCSVCRTKRPVRGGGPTPCRVLLVGENPGPVENDSWTSCGGGRVFCGPTGTELDGLYLPEAGYRRSEVYVTNAYKCYLPREVSQAEVAICARHHVRREIELVRPKLLVLMGAKSNSLIRGHRIDLHHGRGMFVTGNRNAIGYTGEVFSTYHPALGEHDKNMMRPLMLDFRALLKYRRGTLRPAKDQYPNREYHEIKTAAGVHKRISQTAVDYGGLIGMDTELLGLNPYRSRPWCLTFSTQPGTGYLIRATRTTAIEALNDIICRMNLRVVLHGAAFDLPPLHKMGIRRIAVPGRYTDTMVEAYLRGLPQSLKTLGWRLCGMANTKSFTDLVNPYALRHQISYLERAAKIEFPKAEGRKHGLNRRITSICAAYEKGKKDIYTRWRKIDPELRQSAEDELGRMPRARIDMVDFPAAKDYACEDADKTLRTGINIGEVEPWDIV